MALIEDITRARQNRRRPGMVASLDRRVPLQRAFGSLRPLVSAARPAERARSSGTWTGLR